LEHLQVNSALSLMQANAQISPQKINFIVFTHSWLDLSAASVLSLSPLFVRLINKNSAAFLLS
jgi:hypothetical protein